MIIALENNKHYYVCSNQILKLDDKAYYFDGNIDPNNFMFHPKTCGIKCAKKFNGCTGSRSIPLEFVKKFYPNAKFVEIRSYYDVQARSSWFDRVKTPITDVDGIDLANSTLFDKEDFFVLQISPNRFYRNLVFQKSSCDIEMSCTSNPLEGKRYRSDARNKETLERVRLFYPEARFALIRHRSFVMSKNENFYKPPA